jgi:hypothetical protein
MTPRVRQSLYLAGTALSSVLGIALLWGGVSADAAHSANQLIAGALALLGAGAPAVAAHTVGKQAKSGAFESVSPVEMVSNGVTAIVQAKADAEDAVQKATKVVSDALGAGSTLVQQVIDSATKR